ncbi:MAG: hypothetical protein AMJ78_03530 [Omnitrophica WOR_2 bacterium SM23_29]|nr:MAG: hypothetical protein AMJ78_03530 [Omnitrophica WOR_2 bacterium SM23_29]
MLYYERKFKRQGKRYIAGIDEAGRGPLAGPVVASAVILKNFKFKNRIADSKSLTQRSRERAYEEILERAYVGIGVVSEKLVDELNILNATHLAMELAVYDLTIKPDYVLIDGITYPEIPYLKLAIVNGESRSLSIACASIIAKVTRDLIMSYYDILYPKYGFGRHKGYATKMHLRAIKKYGPTPIHRFTFSSII